MAACTSLHGHNKPSWLAHRRFIKGRGGGRNSQLHNSPLMSGLSVHHVDPFFLQEQFFYRVIVAYKCSLAHTHIRLNDNS